MNSASLQDVMNHRDTKSPFYLLAARLISAHARRYCSCPCSPPLLCLLLSLSLCPQPMDQLSAYGAHLGLSKSEFTHQLEHHPASSLHSLKTLLIEEANHHNLIPAELRGLPLVNQRDSALRPVTNVLSEDIWTIIL